MIMEGGCVIEFDPAHWGGVLLPTNQAEKNAWIQEFFSQMEAALEDPDGQLRLF